MNNFPSNATTASRSLTRRQILRHATAGAVGVIGCPAIVRSASLNSKLQVACIGVGGMGGPTINSIASHPNVQITALCDVDSVLLAAASQKYPEASWHRDWRELLAEQGDSFDAVAISTPDHMHAAPAVTAMRANKHLYLQKPMAGTLHECRVITEEAAKAGVVTQLGNQGRSSIESRHTVELIRSGVIGKIQEVILWENKKLGWWPKNTDIRGAGDPVPDTLDWDLWLGVQTPRAYFANTYHPQTWRAWYGFGVGEMGDMGCHHFDISFDALKLTAPLRVRQLTPITTGPRWGKRRQVELVFPGSDMTAEDTIKLTWYDGNLRPEASRIPLPSGVDTLPESGTCWIGETGTIFKNYRGGMPVVLSESKSSIDQDRSHLAKQSHYHDWVDAIIENRPACGAFSHGGPLTEAVLVGAMADRVSTDWLHWDRDRLTFTNSEKATSLVSRVYRDGWKVPGLG